LGLPGSIEAFVAGLRDMLLVSLHSLADAVGEGIVTIEKDHLRIPRLKA